MKWIFFAISFAFFINISTDANANAELREQIKEEYPTEKLIEIFLAYKKDETSLSKFFDSLQEMHIVERDLENPEFSTVTYFAKGSTLTDYFMQSGGPDFYGLRFKQIGDSDYYYCVQRIPSNAWFNYGINEFKKISTETTAFYKTEIEHVFDGSVIGPDAPLSQNVFHNSDTRVVLEQISIESKYMNSARDVFVYLPKTYEPDNSYNILIQLDGENFAVNASYDEQWKGWTPLPTILDNLHSQQKITPVIAIFVLNKDRSKDLLNGAFPSFVVKEVLSTVTRKYQVEPKKVVISGPSRAAYAAASTAFLHSEKVNGVLSQSGSFYYTLQKKENWPIYPKFEGKILKEYMDAETLPIDFYIDVGLYDLGLARVGTNRQFRDILKLKGYEVEYREYNGGHAHLNWRHSISDGLLYFFQSR
ncbi:hypothetical protein RJ44_08830 [Alteromonas macleodii]|uniref:alpha/beta hydrolase n=1 Tax=Alteromonas macleodii TaxID=28108 RepID=UPI00057CFD47|nr:alpha/beta hydrolase-fold protein [Alteromonas macleodii]KHT59388.1 hypothetical protein RJ44_08830 [Alteromonas macleodii]